jgi:hypothetical protein
VQRARCRQQMRWLPSSCYGQLCLGLSRLCTLPQLPHRRMLHSIPVCPSGRCSPAGADVGPGSVSSVDHEPVARRSLQLDQCCVLQLLIRRQERDVGDGRRMSRKLSFPRHAYLVDDGHLAAYALKSGTLSTYALVPPRSATGALRVPHHLVHSTAKGAWLLFCRTAAADGALHAVAAACCLSLWYCSTCTCSNSSAIAQCNCIAPSGMGDGWEFARLTQRGVELPGDSAPQFLPGGL